MAAIAGGLGWLKYQQISQAMAQGAAMPEPMETVEVATVQAGEWSATSRAVGTVVALREVVMMNEQPGVVAEVGFRSGAVVEKDSLLVRLDTRQEQADLTAARAEAELAKLTLARREQMQRNVANSEVDQARAELTAARAKVARLEVAIAKQSIRAPFKARVGLSNLQVGAYLDGGSQIAALQGVDTDAFVDFALPQEQALALKLGDTVTIEARGLEAPLQAEVVARDAAVDSRARTVQLRALAKGMGERLPPGSFVDVLAVTAAPQQVLHIPLTALRRAAYGDHVFVLAEVEGVLRAKQRPVVAGPSMPGESIVIVQGLSLGERIAARGSFKLREDLKVQVADPSALAP